MSKNGKNKTIQEFEFPRAEEKVSFGQMLYNSKEGTYLGRTPKSWAQITLFYTIFYIVLAAMFTICMQGLFSTLNDHEPKWKLDKSLIGTNPGLGYRPLSEETERGSVIQFDTKKSAEGNYWVQLMDQYFESYKIPGRKEKFCSFNQTHKAEEVCVVDIEQFGPCSTSEGYGYGKGRPCIFLKLNKIFSWVPEYYDDPKDLPEDMPADLVEHIANTPQLERQQIWVSCEGQHGNDKERVGEVQFYPTRGFPAYYYPFQNQPGYLSPVIAVQFPKLAINQLISIECRAWAKNIEYSSSNNRGRTGSVAFQIFMD